jgi:hypothetical protein
MRGEAGDMMSERGRGLADHQADELAIALAAGDRALNADGDLQASRQFFERAYRLAEHARDVPAMALAVVGLAGLWVGERRTTTGAGQLDVRLRHVLSLLDAGSPAALRIRARLAGEADYFRGEHAAILAMLDEARSASDPVPLAEALSLAHHCLLGPDHVTSRRELAVDLVKVSFRTERRSDLLMGLLWQTVDAYAEGDPHAGRFLGELRGQLAERDHLAAGFVVSAIDVMLAIRAGQLDEAESLVTSCAKSGAAAGDVDQDWWSAAQLVTIRWYQGRLVELLPMLQQRVHSPALSAIDNSAAAALAVAAALSGDQRTAASALAALSGRDLGNLPRSSSWLVTMNGIVEAAYLLADAEVAAQAYQLLSPHADLPMVGSLGVTCFGSAHHALGVASLTCRQPDQAIDHLHAATRYNLALGHWPALVASRRRLAQAYALRDSPGDADAARRELDTATAEATALGLPIPDYPGSGSASPVAQCHRAGRKWRLAVRNRAVVVEDSIGMVYLAVLIANPGQEIRAAELAAGLAALGSAAGDGGAGRVQPVLDHEAMSEYRNRLKRLDAELRELETDDDGERAARVRAERDWLVAQLASVTGLGGRPRSFPDDGERARVAVSKAIRRAIGRITAADPVIGEHLRQTVRTGMRCSYWPS